MSASTPLRRGYLADAVFSELGAEIARGELVAGATLPPEAALAERFGVSKLIVRQAIHRLAEAGLVEPRQGGATRVRALDEAADLRVIELFYRLAPEAGATRDLVSDVLEKQFSQGMSLVSVFARRASEAARRELVEVAADAPSDDAGLPAYEERFWTAVACGGKNRIFVAEVRWWYRALSARPTMPERPALESSVSFYRELARRLAERDDPVAFYVSALEPAIAALFDPSRTPAPPPRARAKDGGRK